MQPPDMPGFEFVSSFWEDKKPVHTLLDDAYRQNRIATASAVRHLHSLNVNSPVIGLIWANGTVRAHIDWCEVVDGQLVGPSEHLIPQRLTFSVRMSFQHRIHALKIQRLINRSMNGI